MNIKKLVALMLACVMILSVGIMAGCELDGEKETTPTDSPTAVPPTEAPVTAAPTPKPIDDSGNILDWIIDLDNPDLIIGDSWIGIEGSWTGPSKEFTATGAEKNETNETAVERSFVEIPDVGLCYRWASLMNAGDGVHIIGNAFFLENRSLVIGNTYELTIKFKYTTPEPGGENDKLHLGSSIGGDAKAVKLEAKDEWQTATYTFTATDVSESKGYETVTPYIYISPANDAETIPEGWGLREIGGMQAGFELLISEISLTRVDA